jgi:hypothetical protein
LVTLRETRSMGDVISWIMNNWGAIFGAATATTAAASAICALTPTPSDDAVVKKIYNLIELFALNIGKAKQ